MVKRETVGIPMTLRLMLRSAAAAALLAGPAAAQAPAPGVIGACDLAGMTPQTHAALDTDADGALTLDEFRACPAAAGLTPDPAQTGALDTAFADADGDADGRLTLAEVEQIEDTAEATPPAPGTPPRGTVTVTQPAAQVEVTQPAAEVDVTQPAPAVAVETPAPAVAVTPAAPSVAVTPAAPSVAVTPAAPSVEVAQEAPEVTVDPPAAATNEPAAPAEVDPAAARAPAEAAAAPAVEPAPPAVDPTAGATASAPMPPDFQINVVDLDGKDVMNTAGEEVGTVADVLLDPRTDSPVVIVAVGGILGIGDREIPFPYSEFTITGEEVVLNSALTAEQIEDMPEYEEGSYEPLPDTMRVP